jgi:diguanylate cyclase (GGDEF)-like protein
MRSVSLRAALLAGFLFASGAPLMVFWLWPHSTAMTTVMESAQKRHLLLAATLAEALESYDQQLSTVFDAAAPQIAAGGSTFSAPVMVALNFRYACVVDRATGAVVRDLETLNGRCPRRLSPERMAQATELARRGAAGSRGAHKIVSDAGGAPVMMMARTVGDQLVVAAISTARFRKLAERVAFGVEGHAVIVDADGRVLAHPKADWADSARSLNNMSIIADARREHSGVATFHSPALEKDMIAGFAEVDGPGWLVLVPQPLDELREQADSFNASARFVFGAGLVLSCAIALVFSGHLGRAIRQVSKAAERMAAGDDAARVPESAIRGPLGEIATLARTFNLMAERIENSRARMAQIARSDGLTGLLNREGFFEAAQPLFEEALRSGTEYALFFIDVDQFKHVNDSYGHAAGDEMLRETARRLRSAVGDDGLIARQGGDEFLVLVPKRRPGHCARMGGRLLRSLRRPIAIGERRICASASIGVSAFPRDATDVHGLALRADQAMYQAKREGRDALRAFDLTLQRRLDEDRDLLRELRAAIEAGEIRAQFQPIVSARNGGITGFEALARWASPSFGPVSTERFIAMAEETDLIVDLGRQMREQACGFARALRLAGAALPVSVNVSQREISEPDFAPRLLRALTDHDLPPNAIQLEITESLFQTHGTGEMESLFALKKQGVSFALDDFGKGYSSHSRLRTYPIDRLKIAVDFVGDVMTDPGARAVVRSLIDLGRRLRLAVTVEGVETAAQRDLVATLGADEIQGFWHHPPLNAGDAVALAVRMRRMAQALAS